MTDVMEKTLASVSGFLLSTVATRNTDLSPGFCNLVRSVNRARSKSDEEKAVKKELDLLKSKLAQPDVSLVSEALKKEETDTFTRRAQNTMINLTQISKV